MGLCPSIGRSGRESQCLLGDREPAALVTEQISPTTGARGATVRCSPETDRPGTADERQTPTFGATCRQHQLAIADQEKPLGERTNPECCADPLAVTRPVDPGEPETRHFHRRIARNTGSPAGSLNRDLHCSDDPFEPHDLEIARAGRPDAEDSSLRVSQHRAGRAPATIDPEQKLSRHRSPRGRPARAHRHVRAATGLLQHRLPRSPSRSPSSARRPPPGARAAHPAR
jgi:hypothetical protein